MIIALHRRAVMLLIGAAPAILARRGQADSGVIHGDIHEVAIRDMAFHPDRIAARVGDGIRWTNEDLAPHSALATDGSWDSGRMAKGESATVEVTAGMATTYKCRFHPRMKGEIVAIAA